jgi:hypothetical protein
VQWRKHLFIEADHLSRQLMPPGIPALRQVGTHLCHRTPELCCQQLACKVLA